MRLTYDPRHNVAYIQHREKSEQVRTIRVSDDVNVDVAPDGTVFGIELLNANVQLGGDDAGRLLVINEASGERSEVRLAVRA